MDRSKIRIFAFFVVLFGVFGLSPLTVQGKSVIIGQGTDLDILDPTIAFSTMDLVVQGHIFDPLVSRDRDLKLINRLASSYQNIEPTRWRFHLRKGVTFHNGESFNAECVRFTWKQIFAPGSVSRMKGQFNTIADIKVLDDYTIDIITKKPDPSLVARLTMFHIVPPKYISEVGQAKFGRNPIGTGAFKFVEWVRDDRLTLKRNEKYWDGPHPTVKEVVFRVIPEIQSRLAALQTGEVDIASNIPPDLAKRVDTKGRFDLKSVLTTRVIYLDFSSTPGSPILDKRVRLAINYAIDRDAIIKHVLENYGEKVATLAPRIVFGYDPSIPPYPYDPKKAKRLLAEAGYPNGFSIEMAGPAGRYMRDKEILQAVVGQLDKIGVKVDLKLLEWGSHLTKIASRTAAPIFMLGWGQTSLDLDHYFEPIYHSKGAYSQKNDKELDNLIDKARYEIDVIKRKDLYSKIQKLVYDQAYLCPLYEQKDLFGVNKRVDWTPRGDEMVFIRDLK